MDYIWPIIGGLVFFAFISAMVSAPGKTLQTKFVGLGDMRGKTKSEIIAVVGSPNSVSALAGGKSLLQWMASGYHIALIFEGDLCEGISHEHAAK